MNGHFNYYLPTNLVFGRGKVLEAGTLAARYGTRVMVVTGGNSTKQCGLLDKVTELLKKEAMSVTVFDKVRPNPLTTTAEEGARLARENGCQVVVGVGGGSILDCAKAIGFLALNQGDINDYIYGRLTGQEALPLILIPTTCGTGSEGNGFAVLTNPQNGDKKSLRTDKIIAKASIIDSQLMETMPPQVLASVGFDALCHSMEAFLSSKSQPITDMLCKRGMELLSHNLVKVYGGNGDDQAWDGVTLASTIGGMVIHTAGVTLPHGMEHPASGLKNIVHGRGLAALTPVITEASITGAPEKYAWISENLGGNSEKDCREQLEHLLDQLKLHQSLSQLGIQKTDLDWMAENCMKVSAASIASHPVVFNQEEIRELYQKAL